MQGRTHTSVQEEKSSSFAWRKGLGRVIWVCDGGRAPPSGIGATERWCTAWQLMVRGGNKTLIQPMHFRRLKGWQRDICV